MTTTEPAITTVDVRVAAGTLWRRTFDPPIVNGAPLDVTGWVAQAQIRANPRSATVLYTAPDNTLAAADDQVSWTIPAAASAGWAWPVGEYQIDVVDPNNTTSRYRVVRGVIVVDQWSMIAAVTDPESGGGAGSAFPPFYPPAYPSGGG